MRSNKKHPGHRPAPIFIEVTAPQPQRVGSQDAAAMRDQLTRYARDIQAYVKSSRINTLLQRVQADINSDKTDGEAYPRLCRE